MSKTGILNSLKGEVAVWTKTSLRDQMHKMRTIIQKNNVYKWAADTKIMEQLVTIAAGL